MDIAGTIGLLLFVVHIVAFVAGGSNSVVMPILAGKLASATPEMRGELMDIAHRLARVGKYSMIALIVTGLLVLWLKWNFVVPNVWFWVKMAGIVAMLVFIGLNESMAKRVAAGDADALQRSELFGKLTGAAFLVVVLSAVFAFN
jgi:protoporphyrinogen IX oxidase